MIADGIAQRLAFLGIGPSDFERLVRLKPYLERRADACVDAFYRHLIAFEPTRRLLRDPVVCERLLAKQREYLLSLAVERVDEAYVERRRRIGETHERIGLEPRWYLGAYSLYFSLLMPVVHEACDDVVQAASTLSSLEKILMLDTELALESYIGEREQALESMAGVLAREGMRLSRKAASQHAEIERVGQRARAAEERAAIATIVAGLAHEIGTPMGVIQGHAKLLEKEIGSEDGTWRLRTIQEQVARISKIMQTLVNMARPRESKRIPVPLASVVESTLGFIEDRLAKRKIELSLDASEAVTVSGDPERLQQLLLNLLLNAVDSMPDGGELHVRLTRGDGGARIEIEDTGTGIATKHVDRIYEPFFTTKGAGDGSGLGLAICRGIAEDHGGSIAVHSVEGEGTTFEVELPEGVA
jgi:signal transduction histidine kinase